MRLVTEAHAKKCIGKGQAGARVVSWQKIQLPRRPQAAWWNFLDQRGGEGQTAKPLQMRKD